MDINEIRNSALEEVRKIAAERGGECLATEYRSTYLKFRCAAKHEWDALPSNIKKGSWCRSCELVDQLAEIREIAAKRGGECLATEYRPTKLKFRCRVEHHPEWDALPSNIKKGGWCRFCSQKLAAREKLGVTMKSRHGDLQKFNDFIAYAASSGFNIIENKWHGTKKNYHFFHIESGEYYEGNYSNIKKRGFPLSNGQKYVTEEVCRQIFRYIFGGVFLKNRDRLKTKHGKDIELDGYHLFNKVPSVLAECPDFFHRNFIEIAFEYQGHVSHYEDKKTIQRDKLRIKYCDEENIVFVVIEAIANTDKCRDSNYMFNHVCTAIRNSISNAENLKFPNGFQIDLSGWNQDTVFLSRLSDHAEKNGFKLLEDKFIGAKAIQRFLHIESGKICEWSQNQVMGKAGFPKDLRNALDFFNELVSHAEKNGFKLLEDTWLGSAVNHQFLHKESGKIINRRPNTVMGKRGFPKNI